MKAHDFDRMAALLIAKAKVAQAVEAIRSAEMLDPNIVRRDCLDVAIERLSEYLDLVGEPIEDARSKIVT